MSSLGKILSVLFLILLSSCSRDAENSVSGEQDTVLTPGMTIKNGMVRDYKPQGESTRTEWFSYSTPLQIVGERDRDFIIRFSDSPALWLIDKTLVVTGEESIADYLYSRLTSTYSEGSFDGYSWHNRKINYDRNAPLSRDKLLSTLWTPIDEPLFALLFYIDGVFMYGAYDTGIRIKGRYEVEGETVRLYDINIIDKTHRIDTILARKGEVFLEMGDVNTYYATQGLVNESLDVVFSAAGSEPQRGELVEIQGYDARILNKTGLVIGETTPLNRLDSSASVGTNHESVTLIEGTLVDVIARLDDERDFYYCSLSRTGEYYGIVYLWISGQHLQLENG